MKTFYSILIFVSLALCDECSAERVWSEGRFPYEGSSIEIPFKKEANIFSSFGNLKVKINTSCPIFQRDSLFIQRVNKHLCNNAQEVFCSFIQRCSEEEQKEGEFDEEAISMDFDKREISYILTPTYASSRLISVFGELRSYVGMPHGSSRYYAINYWSDGEEVQELTLDRLFLPDKNFTDFVIDYCLGTLRKEKIGYKDNLLLEIDQQDLNVFTLSKNGFQITFQPYHVGGWADGPYSITIPFQKLMPFIRPEGPLQEFVLL